MNGRKMLKMLRLREPSLATPVARESLRACGGSAQTESALSPRDSRLAVKGVRKPAKVRDSWPPAVDLDKMSNIKLTQTDVFSVFGTEGGSSTDPKGSAPPKGSSDKKNPGNTSKEDWQAEFVSHLGEERDWKKSEKSVEERFELCKSVGDECLKEEELLALLKVKEHPVCYDGFEPSGRMHIAQGILRVLNVNKLTAAGCVFRFWVADWFAMLNNKMGGDLKKIRTVGRYMIEIWRAAGMDMDNVQFLWASDEINRNPEEYWGRVMDIATKFSVARISRCCTIMGRKESEEMSAAQIMYACMQCADIFFLKADICQLGMDQRKVNVLAREYCDARKPKIKHKPVILSHHMLMGLKQGQEKMSKSDPDSAIFMEDTEADVKRKIKKAYCVPAEVEGNPVMDYMKHLVFPSFPEVVIQRKPEAGGDITFTKYEDLEAEYLKDNVYPNDVKVCLTGYLNKLLEPVRKHFASGEPKKLLDQVKKFKVTR